MIKNRRQLATAKRKLEKLEKVAAASGSSGTSSAVRHLQAEIREYLWLKKSTPADVAAEHPLVSSEEAGPWIARIRIAAGLTQADLARKLGCQQPDVARFESARYREQSLRVLRAVARIAGLQLYLSARPGK